MLWCDLHGVMRQRRGSDGETHVKCTRSPDFRGAKLSSSGIRALLNFAYAEYEAGAYTRPLFSST